VAKDITTGADGADEPQLETSNYELIRRRLLDQGRALVAAVDALDQRRQEFFGSTALEVVGSETLTTADNCIPRDIVDLGDRLLFGYQLSRKRAEMTVDAVFSLHRFVHEDDAFELHHVPEDASENMLGEPSFVSDFDTLFFSYTNAFLRQLRRPRDRTDKLFAVFQTGTSLADTRVLHWDVSVDHQPRFVDSAGAQLDVRRPAHDFDWIKTVRDQHVLGRHPHINILNTVFVETVGGDLTVKIEDDTEDGQGIYSEDDLVDRNQSLGDADISYAQVGGLILLRIKPYREEAYRYLVFNTLTKTVRRVDDIGLSCVTLPEEQGVLFPGGFALATGEVKLFDADTEGMRIEDVRRSPNGEDVLYVFYRESDGQYLLLSYNVIRKEVYPPIPCYGYSVFEDGMMLTLRWTDARATQIHPIQVWRTPYVSERYAAGAPRDGSFMSRIGNADLVRAISDALALARMVENTEPTSELYAAIMTTAERMVDQHHWLTEDEAGGIDEAAHAVARTARLVLEEFEKARAMRANAADELARATRDHSRLLTDVRNAQKREVADFVDRIAQLRRHRGRLIGLREVKYIDLAAVEALEDQVAEADASLTEATAEFLTRDDALASYEDALGEVVDAAAEVATTPDADALRARLDTIGEGLNTLTGLMGSLRIDDPQRRTQLVERISEVLGQQNRARALVDGRRDDLLEAEGKAEFAIQFQLLGQAVTSALGMCETPEDCDDQLERLLSQLEDVSDRFSGFDGFMAQLADKREEILEALEARKQQLLDARQRAAGATMDAAERMLAGVVRRAQKIREPEELRAYFAADASVLKIRELAGKLRDLDAPIQADDLEAKLLSTRDQTIRTLRDKLELFEEGEGVIALGRHRFTVDDQPRELTMVPRQGTMRLHITGTDFYEPIEDPAFAATRAFWDQPLPSEHATIARAEFLASVIFRDAEEGKNGNTLKNLHDACVLDEEILPWVRRVAEARYDEGYERGVHDADAAAILRAVTRAHAAVGALRHPPRARALAALFWASPDPGGARAVLARRAASLGRLRAAFDAARPPAALTGDLSDALTAWRDAGGLGATFDDADVAAAAEYLLDELAHATPRFVLSGEGKRLADTFLEHLDAISARADFDEDMAALAAMPGARYELARTWLGGFMDQRRDPPDDQYALPEAVAHVITLGALEREVGAQDTWVRVEGLLGQHARIRQGNLTVRLDEWLAGTRRYALEHVPAWRAYREAAKALVERERAALRLEELEPRVLSTFVRNVLIDEVYLPLIGDNLAKQMGTAGDDGRTDRMGLLLLVSPPGYGKTTLMEYVANRLGLTFIKVNGPALGHGVTSLDPSEATSATARQEVDKINLALRMGNNVLLYLDDIQHTNPELLQKFISLCDATRRIEGVWRGTPKTYDLRGKRFAVVMAGNPYTETGERFQIPDMLSNRADTYNLGDILEGSQRAFELSYLENALTSNPTLAPLANRSRGDVHRFIRMARGEQIPLSELEGTYSSVEAGEIVSVFTKLIACQRVLLQVNQAYIQSASQDDAYRTEPPFKLQGSYRNMTKLAEKVASAMTDDELDALIDDHYQGESQTLTTEAEHNLLKLAELRGRLEGEAAARWEEIKREYRRRKLMGGGDDDPVARVAGPLGGLVDRLDTLTGTIAGSAGDLARRLDALEARLARGGGDPHGN
jgi:hypothetical protein